MASKKDIQKAKSGAKKELTTQRQEKQESGQRRDGMGSRIIDEIDEVECQENIVESSAMIRLDEEIAGSSASPEEPDKDFDDFCGDLDKIGAPAHFKLILKGKPGLSLVPLNNVLNGKQEK